MDEQPFPLPRATRETEILNGDGGTVYGPFGFKIFDTEDVHAYVRHAGEDWQTAAVTAHKVAGLEFDDFTVTFAEAVPATSDYLVQASRLHGRQTAVTRGGAISGRALEKELSKQGSVIEELRRDVNRYGSVVPVEPGRVLIAGGDGRMRPGPSADEISGAQESASIALEAAEAAQDARDAALAAVPNAFPSDRTELKALNTATITAAYLKEAGREGQWLWDATVPIATHQADVFEQRYIAPDDAEDGAWVRAGSVQTGGRFTNESPAPRIHRFADRVFVGDAVAYNGARDGDATGSWLFDDTGGTYTREYMEAAAQFASVSSAGIAFTGAARGGPGKGSSIGVIGFGMSYGDGGDYDNAYGFYGEGIRGNPNASAWAMELNSVNLHPSPAGTNPFTPFGAINSSKPNGLGTTLGITLMAGGDPLVNPVTYDSDVALEIGSNGARWLTGLNFDDNALYRHPDGRSYAVNLARGHMLTWYDDATATLSPAFRIVSETSHSDYYREILANDSGVGIRNKDGDYLFRVGMTLGENGVEILPDGAPVIAPMGAAPDINLVVRGKGIGGVNLVAGGSTIVSVNAAGLSFYGETPVAKQEVTGSRGGNAALTSLIQKLALLGLISDSTT